jgi:transcriptional regulator with XRE-family HTH domain
MEETWKTEFFEQLKSVTDMAAFGHLLKRLREREGSQELVAKKVDVSVPTLLNLEHGSVKNPREETLQKIFFGLGFSEEDFGRIWEKVEQLKSGKLVTPKALAGQETSGTPKAPEASGKSRVVDWDVFSSAKVMLRETLLDINERKTHEVFTVDQVEASLAKAGFGQEEITTSEIRLAELRELCVVLSLDDEDKAIIVRLLGFAQKDYIITVAGGDNLLLGKVLFD